MVMDANGRGHEPAGTTKGGRYTANPGADDDSDLELSGGYNHTRRTLYDEYESRDKGWIWAENLLRATKPMPDGTDYTDESVCTPEQEVELRTRAIGEESHPGYIMRSLHSWIPDNVRCREMAERLADERLLALRRSCAVKSDHCYSARLVQSALSRPVHMEGILAQYGLSAHRMRVGRPYLNNLEEYRRRTGDRNPSGETRDRIWNETLADYVQDKLTRGKTFGGGLAYSDGSNAKPGRPDRKPWVDPKTGRTEAFNGRKDFEGMYERGMSAFNEQNLAGDFETAIDTHGVTDAMEGGGDTIRNAYNLAFEQGLDVQSMNRALGLNAETVERWREEWERGRM